MPKKEKKDSAKEVERNFTVNLSKVKRQTRPKRANKAVSEIRVFIARHMKVGVENVKVSQKLNELLWSHGRENATRKVKVKALSDGKLAGVYLEGEKIEKKEKKAKEEKEEKAEATEEQKKAEEEKERKKEEKKLIEQQADRLAKKKN